MPDESPRPESKPNLTQPRCPDCTGLVVPLPGISPVKALEEHLKRDHWYSWQLAHDTASEAFTQIML